MPYFSSSGDFPNTPGSTEDIEDVVADLQQLATSLDSAHVDLMQLVAALAPYSPTTLRDVDGKVLGVLGMQQGSAPPIFGLDGYLIHFASGAALYISFEDAIADIPKETATDAHWFLELEVSDVDGSVPYFTGVYSFVTSASDETELWDEPGFNQAWFRLPIYHWVDNETGRQLVSQGGAFREDIFTASGRPVVGLIRIS